MLAFSRPGLLLCAAVLSLALPAQALEAPGPLVDAGWLKEMLGKRQSRLYEGSMVEWTLDPGAPVEQKNKLP
jgi:hypothetical protein